MRSSQRSLGAFLIVYAALLLDWYLPGMYARHPVGFWVLDVLKFVVVPAVALWALQHFGERPELKISMGLPSYPRPFLALVIATMICMVLLPVIWFIPKPLPWSYLWSSLNPNFHIGDTIPKEGVARYALLAYVAAAPAMTEEIFFRGVLRSIIVSWTRRTDVYVLASGVLFASIHWENGSTAVENAFIYGLVAAWLFVRLRNLWPLIAGHLITDWLAFSPPP